MILSDRQRTATGWALEDGYWYSAEGAIRSGKSHGCMLGFLLYTQSEERRGQEHIIAGRTLSSLRRNVLRPMQRTVEEMGGSWVFRRLDGYVLINGVEYSIFGANDDAAQDRLQGMTAGCAMLDEAARLPRSFIEQAQARTSYGDSKVWSTLNPEGPRHWLKLHLEELERGGVVHRERYTLRDNPWLDPKVVDRYEQQFTGVWYARYILGEWAAASGAIWPDVREGVPPSGRAVRSYEIGFDYASSSTAAALLIARYGDGVDHVQDELYLDAEGSSMSDVRIVDAIMARWRWYFERGRIGAVWADPSAASFRAEWRRQGGRVPIRRGFNEVNPGLRIVGSRFKEGKLTVGKACGRFLGEAYGYQWDEKAQELGEDRPQKRRDHGCDALRYMVASRYRRVGLGRRIEKPEGF